ncbi:MAG: AAA family ATPase [Candidatus Solibacter usitatus]|nr:AAA family ATPase [Candidatus Solibacter usitatus]
MRTVLVAPAGQLASEIRSRLEEEGGFEVVAQLESLPGAERFTALKAQVRPDCVFLDASDADQAVGWLKDLEAAAAECPLVAFAAENRPGAVLPLLRAGAFDYLASPFPEDTLQVVHGRLRRHCTARAGGPAQALGRVLGFASGKPGSGASTLVAQTAFAVRRHTGKRVLLVDLNFQSGTSSAWAGVRQQAWSVVDALAALARNEEPSNWESRLVLSNGISILPAPARPEAGRVPTVELLRLVETMRREFDWVLLDLPCAADILTLSFIPELDSLVAVTTPELASLHLAGRSIQALMSLGLAPGSLHLALNRVTKRDALQVQEVEKVLKRKIAWTVPNDYFTLHNTGLRALTSGTALALAVRRMAVELTGPAEPQQAGALAAPQLEPLRTAAAH